MTRRAHRGWRQAAVIPLLTLLVTGAAGCGGQASASAVARPVPSARPAPSARPVHATAVELTGDLTAHDPSLTVVGNDWYVLFTGDALVDGGALRISRSRDGHRFTSLGTAFPIPAWVRTEVPGVTALWAPEVFRHGSLYYLYYAASTFGSNTSVIGLATSPSLDPGAAGYRWTDQGLVYRSTASDDFNAIDPSVAQDAEGLPYLTFGSFWSGIRQVRLQWPGGKPAPGQGAPARLVDRGSPPNAVEAPYIVRHEGWFYLLTSWDLCCRGLQSTYRIVAGRSRSITGPYQDRTGARLIGGGGSTALSSQGTIVGPGGQSYSQGYLAFHYYDGNANGAPTLAIRKVAWDGDGWPVLTTG
jgi:arabinan endo-1,5-alpha-L-arabinosidase